MEQDLQDMISFFELTEDECQNFNPVARRKLIKAYDKMKHCWSRYTIDLPDKSYEHFKSYYKKMMFARGMNAYTASLKNIEN